MPPVCTLCRRPDRAEIDALLVAPTEPLRNIAAQFGTSPATLLRHRDHIPKALAVAVEAEAVAQADTLLEKVQQIEADARRLLKKAELTGDLRCAIAAAKTGLEVIEMMHKIGEREELTDRELTERFLNSADWHQVKETMVAALEPYPEAGEAVAAALESHDRREAR